MNFCSPKLKPIFSSDKPACDGFEVENLVSDAAPSKGFVAEAFIRPPVDIKIKFIVPIDVSHIVISSIVGHHQTLGFMLFSNTTKSPDEVSYCIGRFFTNGERTVIIKNAYYKHHSSYPIDIPNPRVHKDSETFFGHIKHSSHQNVMQLESLIIRLAKPSPRTNILALGHIQVWGQPSACTNPHQVVMLSELMAKDKDDNGGSLVHTGSVHKLPSFAKYHQFPYLSVASTSTKTEPETLLQQLAIEDIPEDFLDPITCELMTIPVLLPSGNSVDASTLEKFSKNELSWGRKSSDPFTGVPFTENVKPTANVHLKSRIDRFLLLGENKQISKTTGQTVGAVYKPHKYDPSSFLNKRKLEKSTVGGSDLHSTEPSGYLPSVIPKTITSLNKAKEPIKNLANKRYKVDKKFASTASSSKTNCSLISRLSNNEKELFVKSHLPNENVIRIPIGAKPTNIINGNCTVKAFDIESLRNSTEKCFCNGKVNLYVFPCRHLICRNCLTKTKESLKQCLNCQKSFASNEIEKYTFKSVFS